jgi:predicted ArsR family transcriptional regulator
MRQTVIARRRLIVVLKRSSKALTVRELALRVGRNENTVQQQLYGLVAECVVERARSGGAIWRYKLTGAPLPDFSGPARIAVGHELGHYNHRPLAAALGTPSGDFLRGMRIRWGQSRVHRFEDGS